MSFVRDLKDGRRFANDSRGRLYLLDKKGQPSIYLDVAKEYPLGYYRALQSGFVGFAFHPEFDYAAYEVNGRAVILAEALAATVAQRTGKTLGAKLAAFKGEALTEPRFADETFSHGFRRRVGLVFVVAGMAFKLGAVPFHMWVPDVYQGAPTPITLFIGSAPKLAAFAMAIRLLADGLGGLAGEWRDMLNLLSVASMAVGNLVAIVDRNEFQANFRTEDKLEIARALVAPKTIVIKSTVPVGTNAELARRMRGVTKVDFDVVSH